MTQVQSPSSTGGTITEFFDKDGVRVRVTHSAGKTYSGKAAEKEQKPVDNDDL